MTQDQEEWLRLRIKQLRSKQRRVGPFRYTGIQRTIEGMQKQLSSGEWEPHVFNPD